MEVRAWVYYGRRMLLATVPVLGREFTQVPLKEQPQSAGASGVRGTKSRALSGDDTPPPALGGLCGELRTEGTTPEQHGADRDAGAKVKATENAVVRKTGDVRSKASLCASLPLHDRFGPGGLPRASSLPHGYVLDASDPDVVLLLRADGTSAAMFSARGVSAEGIMEAAWQDARAANLSVKLSSNRTASRVDGETVSARNLGRI